METALVELINYLNQSRIPEASCSPRTAVLTTWQGRILQQNPSYVRQDSEEDGTRFTKRPPAHGESPSENVLTIPRKGTSPRTAMPRREELSSQEVMETGLK